MMPNHTELERNTDDDRRVRYSRETPQAESHVSDPSSPGIYTRLTPANVQRMQSLHGNAFVSRLIQRGKKKKDEDTGPPPMQVFPKKLKDVITNDEEMNSEDQFKFQRTLAAYCNVSFKGHAPHGSNFSKKQTAKQAVRNLLDGIQDGGQHSSVVAHILTQTGVDFSE